MLLPWGRKKKDKDNSSLPEDTKRELARSLLKSLNITPETVAEEYDRIRKSRGKSAFDASVWKKGEVNPVSTKASISNGELSFLCPTCQLSTAPDKCSDVDPIIGHNYKCFHCSGVSHVPGAFNSSSIPTDAKITGGVLVPIIQYSEYCYSHPIFRSYVETQKSDLFDNYGLWAYCAKCYHIYNRPVLNSFITMQSIGPKSFTFLAKTDQSAKDMEALSSGRCPSCSHDTLIAVITDVPDYVCEYIETQK